jgi:aryl-phospho-beta-D-glucosidase BglC (GH1 family)
MHGIRGRRAARGLRVPIAVVVLALVTVAGDRLSGQTVFASFYHVEGRHIVADATGEKVVFRGVNLSGLEFGARAANPYPGVLGTNYFLPRPRDLDAVKAMGMNVVRLPFEWARLVPGWSESHPLPGSLDAAYLALLESVIREAASRQLYVILDMHDFLKYWSGTPGRSALTAARPTSNCWLRPGACWRRTSPAIRRCWVTI